MSGEVEDMSTDKRKEAVRAQLVRVFGDKCADIVDYVDTVWCREQFTVWPGDQVRVRRHNNNGHRVYQQPLLGGRVIVAGTETSAQSGGYMEGGVNSAHHVMTLLANKL